MRRICRNPISWQRGAVLAEMALVTPILLLMMLATAQVTPGFVGPNRLKTAVR